MSSRRAKKAKEDKANALFLEAKEEHEGCNFENAISLYKQATKLNPKFAKAYNCLGNALRDGVNDYEGANTAYLKAISIEPSLFTAHYNLSLLREKQDNLEGAEVAIRKAIECNPGFSMAYQGLGDLLQRTGRGEQACKSYVSAIKLDPTDLLLYVKLGMAKFGLSKYDEAIEAFTTARRLNPTHVPTLTALGTALTVRQRYTEAVKVYKEVIQLDPSVNVYTNLGTALIGMESWQDATKALQIAVKRNPRDTAAILNLAKVFQIIGTHERAIQTYKYVMHVDPSLASTAFMAMGDAFMACKNIVAAIDNYKSVLKTTKTYLINRSAVIKLYKLCDAKSVKDLELYCVELTKSAPLVAVYQAQLAQLYKLLKQHDKALAAISSAIRLDPVAFIYRLEKGDLFSILEQWDVAEKEYRNALNLNMENNHIRTKLAHVLELQEKLAAARAIYVSGDMDEQVTRVDELLKRKESQPPKKKPPKKKPSDEGPNFSHWLLLGGAAIALIAISALYVRKRTPNTM